MDAQAYVPFVGEEVNRTFSEIKPLPRTATPGISEVRLESVDEILHLQEKVYSDVCERRNTKSVLESYIAASIARAVCDAKPQLSYEYRDKDLRLIGFVLSLVGNAECTRTRRFVNPLKKFATHTACVYVSEWCTLGQAVGGLLLKRFFSDYARFYLEDSISPAIIGDHRLSTSFGLIKRGIGLIEQIINTEKPCDGMVYLQRAVGGLRITGDEQRAVLLVPKVVTTQL